MDILKFRVRGQALTLTNPNIKLIPVTDTVNQYLCQFEFSEDWDGLNKVVVFKNVSYNISKEVYLSTSNECYIPWEVLSNSGEIFLEVIGTEVRGEVVTVRIPSTLLGFKWEIQEGLLDVSANISPTPDLFEQFVSSVRSDSIVAATARDEAVIARDVAVQSAADASASELAATSAAESAVNSASTASSAASSASESALSVAGVADETKSYAEIASAKAADASTQAEIAAGAKEDAVTAKAGAEAARDEAATSADLAQTTESHIKTMTVSAHSLAETEAPTVTKTDTSTGFALDFGIPKGATGPKGEDGDNIHYTWVKYADTPTSGMSDNPTGKAYIGIAYNKSTPVGSTVYSDYAWSRIKGEPGEDGYSPTVTTGTASDGSTTLTVTNKTGSTTTTLADGKARADINNLEIGGRNYFSNKTDSAFNEANEFTLANYGNTGSYTQFWNLTVPMSYFVGKKCILSFDCISPNGSTPISVYNTGGSPRYKINTSGIISPINNEWLHQELIITVTDQGDSSSYNEAKSNKIEIYCSAQMGCKVRNVKLEIGNRATDWTPAPEDVQAEIDNIEIGGRNLLIGSEKGVVNTNADTSSLADLKLQAYNGSTYVGQEFAFGVTAGEHIEYTYTSKYSCDRVRIGDNGGTYDTVETFLVSEYKEGVVYTLSCDVIDDRPNVVGGYVLKNIKLEKGNKATDWTPAPEDKANAPVLLWTNASPTSEFGAQAVLNNPTGQLSAYDSIEVKFYNENITVRVTKGKPSLELSPLFMVPNAQSRWVVSRYIDFDDNEVFFENCWGGNTYDTGQRNLQNNYLIPYKVYGIKEV